MKKLYSIFLAVLISASFSFVASPASAADQVFRLPERITAKSWVWPKCDGAKRVQIYTKRFVFEGSRTGNLLWRPVTIMKNGPVYRMQSGVGTEMEAGSITSLPLFDIRLIRDGRLMRYDLPIFVKEDASDPFFSGEAFSYYPCSEIESSYPELDQLGLEAIRSLDHVDSVCGTVPIARSPACQKAVFDAFDNDKSETLSAAEIEKAFQQVIFSSASLGCDMKMYYPANTEIEAASFASQLLEMADEDGDGTLSLEEIQTGWKKIRQAEAFALLTPHLDNLSILLRFLPAGAPMPGCSCTTSL